jgi:hypothetical protein
MIDIITDYEAEWAADIFIEYFSHMQSIEDYMRYVKLESITNQGSLFSLNHLFFNEDMHPEDMEFQIRFVGKRFTNSVPQEQYDNLLSLVSSSKNEKNIPGRELKWIVYEKNTSKIVGFIRFGSPVINSKPRNLWLETPPNLSIFNRHAVMGFAIVPSQPFGYNYLGGKLLSLICCSHYAREVLNEVFEKEICLFETTSLYGSTTSASQYDGLEPYIKYKGLTESKFLPLLHDEIFHKLHDRFTHLNNNTPLTSNSASSKKMKRQNKMISIIRNSLKNEEKLKIFNGVVNSAFNLTQRKRFYISTYGYENTKDILIGKSNKLIPAKNWDRFYLENIVEWWKKKSSKRYQKLKSENRFRKEVELWSEKSDIQIIR